MAAIRHVLTLSSNPTSNAVDYDPDLGWRNTPNLRAPNRFGEGKCATHNSRGFRSDKEFSPQIPQGKLRIICVGDSFTYGDGCADDETYPAQLQAIDPSIETINMGAGGYGIDQAYLWYKRDGLDFDADVLLFAFIQDDFERLALPTRMTRIPKPLLVVENESLQVTNVPVPTWGAPSSTWLGAFPKKTATFQVLNKIYDEAVKTKDVFPVATQIFDEMHQLSQIRVRHYVLVYLPTRFDDLIRKSKYASRVKKYAASRNVHFIDLTETFKNLPPEILRRQFLTNLHYSPDGNRLVAQTLIEKLEKMLPDFPNKKTSRVRD